jgi:uncharacterized protein (TIGR02217 family)
MFATDIIVVRAGYESRNANWSQSRRRYDIQTGVKTKVDFQSVADVFHAVGGRLDGFRFKDWADFEATISNGALYATDGTLSYGSAGTGYSMPVLQLVKKYTAGSSTHLREIRKPIAPIVIYRGGTPATAGVGAGNYAIDLTTGLVTFVADQSRAISSHTPGTTHILTLASAFSPNLTGGQRVYITGVTGTAADLLNGLSHNVVSAVAATVTISTNTTGLTASGGNAFIYAQASETLTWAGEFDVPVRFESDELQAVIQDKTGDGTLLMTAPVQLIEIRT